MKASSMITCALCVVICQLAIGCAELEPMDSEFESCNEVDGQMVCLMYAYPELEEVEHEQELKPMEYASAERWDVPRQIHEYEIPTIYPERRRLALVESPDLHYKTTEDNEDQVDDEGLWPEGDMALCPQRIPGYDGPDQCLVDIVPVEEPFELVAVECVYEPCDDQE